MTTLYESFPCLSVNLLHDILRLNRTAMLQVCLMNENGDTREDLTLPDKTDDDKKLAGELRALFEEGEKTIVVTVLGVSQLNPCNFTSQLLFPGVLNASALPAVHRP